MLLAFLGETAFDSFEETADGLKAYILEKDWEPSILEDLMIVQNGSVKISYTTEKLDTINWNEEWERHYEPISIGKDIYIHAPFHTSDPSYKFNLLIEPKMSFGTGHHQTTRLMSLLLMQMDVAGKQVLDMGTGTGVLAILAEKLGASKVLAVDNFEWAVENTAENAERNQCKTVEALHGDAEILVGKKFNTILANINRNVLLEDMAVYVSCLNAGGELAMSGFFEQDKSLIEEEANRLGLELTNHQIEGKWAACLFTKT
jgi:ribosomal protein L11 methyltransferase